MENFISRQADLVSKLESGSYGFRGLQGCPSRIPSDIVEKILQTLKESEKELRRKQSVQSMTSSASFGGSAIPARFQIICSSQKTSDTALENISNSNVSKGNLEKAKSMEDHENNDKEADDILDQANSSDGDISDCESVDVSDNSDWSDEEKENLEKIFGKMSKRAVECPKGRV